MNTRFKVYCRDCTNYGSSFFEQNHHCRVPIYKDTYLSPTTYDGHLDAGVENRSNDCILFSQKKIKVSTFKKVMDYTINIFKSNRGVK